jgi:hypothetical protein
MISTDPNLDIPVISEFAHGAVVRSMERLTEGGSDVDSRDADEMDIVDKDTEDADDEMDRFRLERPSDEASGRQLFMIISSGRS